MAMKAAAHDEPRSRLGRGLAALIGDSGQEADAVVRVRGQRRVPIEFLRRNPRNPRQTFDEADLEELTASVKEKGIIQPILVRTVPGTADAYEIIAGERRWRAAQRAGVHDVPIVTVEADDKQALEIAIIENVQRTNLNAVEEAKGYEQLGKEFGYNQGELAKVIGKSRAHISNTMRILQLPAETLQLVSAGSISAGHARALLNSAAPQELGEKIVARGLSVRAVEDLVRRESEARAAAEANGEVFGSVATRRTKDPDTLALEKRIGDAVGLKVDLNHQGEGGNLKLRYETLEQLDRLVALLTA